jgi:hypothetical protein
VEVTLLDVAYDVLGTLLTSNDLRLRGGGLRAGRWSIDFEARQARLLLHQVEVVPGVRITGAVRGFGRRWQRARLRLSGSAAPEGVLELAGPRVRGRLGGKPVRGSIVIGVLEDAGAARAEVLPKLPQLMRAARELAQRTRQR